MAADAGQHQATGQNCFGSRRPPVRIRPSRPAQSTYRSWNGPVSLGFGPDGKRVRKVRGRTKTEVKDKLQDLHDELRAGIRSSPTYTVQNAVDDWLAHGLQGRPAKTISTNREVLPPLTALIGAAKLKELTAADAYAGVRPERPIRRPLGKTAVAVGSCRDFSQQVRGTFGPCGIAAGAEGGKWRSFPGSRSPLPHGQSRRPWRVLVPLCAVRRRIKVPRAIRRGSGSGGSAPGERRPGIAAASCGCGWAGPARGPWLLTACTAGKSGKP